MPINLFHSKVTLLTDEISGGDGHSEVTVQFDGGPRLSAIRNW